MTTITAGAATAPNLSSPAEDRVSDAARHLYEAEIALHIARQSGVDAWIAAAYDHLHPAVIDYEAALAATAEPTVAAADRSAAQSARTTRPAGSPPRLTCPSGRQRGEHRTVGHR